jgi:hypothetical protein
LKPSAFAGGFFVFNTAVLQLLSPASTKFTA